MARKLPPDRLPLGTRRDLTLLLARCKELEHASVYVPKQGIFALERVCAYLRANPVEGKAE